MGIAVDNALRDPLDRSGDSFEIALISSSNSTGCLLYTSDAADEL